MRLKSPFVSTFALTAAILLPAGFHELGAGRSQVAQLVRPGTATIDLDGAAVKVSTDKAIVESGGIVRVTLAADSARPQTVKLALLVEEAQGTGGGRVESPPDTVADEIVELEARPGGGPAKMVAFKLRGFRGVNMEGMDAFGYYTILVMKPAAAKKFEKLLRRARPDDGSEFWSVWDKMRSDEDNTQVARLEVRTRDIDPGFRIIAPEKVRAGEKFKVVVELTNQDPKSMKDAEITLSTPSLGADYLGLEGDAVTIGGEGAIEGKIAHGQKRRVEFEVTAKTPGLLGLYAQGRADEHGETTALDAVEVLPAAPTLAHN